MAQEPELKIKVGVDPRIKGEDFKSKIQEQVDKHNKNGIPVKIKADTEDFSASITSEIEKSLNGIDGTATKTYQKLGKNLTNVLNDINTNLAAQMHTLTDSLNTLMTGREYQINFRTNGTEAVNKDIAKLQNKIDKNNVGFNFSTYAKSASSISAIIKGVMEEIDNGNNHAAQGILDHFEGLISDWRNLNVDLENIKLTPNSEEAGTLDTIKKSYQELEYILNACDDALRNGTTLAQELGADSEYVINGVVNTDAITEQLTNAYSLFGKNANTFKSKLTQEKVAIGFTDLFDMSNNGKGFEIPINVTGITAEIATAIKKISEDSTLTISFDEYNQKLIEIKNNSTDAFTHVSADISNTNKVLKKLTTDVDELRVALENLFNGTSTNSSVSNVAAEVENKVKTITALIPQTTSAHVESDINSGTLPVVNTAPVEAQTTAVDKLTAVEREENAVTTEGTVADKASAVASENATVQVQEQTNAIKEQTIELQKNTQAKQENEAVESNSKKGKSKKKSEPMEGQISMESLLTSDNGAANVTGDVIADMDSDIISANIKVTNSNEQLTNSIQETAQAIDVENESLDEEAQKLERIRKLENEEYGHKSKYGVLAFDNQDEFDEWMQAFEDADRNSEFGEIPSYFEDKMKYMADMEVEAKGWKSALNKFKKAFNQFPTFKEDDWFSYMRESAENGSFEEADINGGYAYGIELIDEDEETGLKRYYIYLSQYKEAFFELQQAKKEAAESLAEPLPQQSLDIVSDESITKTDNLDTSVNNLKSDIIETKQETENLGNTIASATAEKPLDAELTAQPPVNDIVSDEAQADLNNLSVGANEATQNLEGLKAEAESTSVSLDTLADKQAATGIVDTQTTQPIDTTQPVDNSLFGQVSQISEAIQETVNNVTAAESSIRTALQTSIVQPFSDEMTNAKATITGPDGLTAEIDKIPTAISDKVETIKTGLAEISKQLVLTPSINYEGLAIDADTQSKINTLNEELKNIPLTIKPKIDTSELIIDPNVQSKIQTIREELNSIPLSVKPTIDTSELIISKEVEEKIQHIADALAAISSAKISTGLTAETAFFPTVPENFTNSVNSYTQDVGAVAGVNQYFAQETDNLKASLDALYGAFNDITKIVKDYKTIVDSINPENISQNIGNYGDILKNVSGVNEDFERILSSITDKLQAQVNAMKELAEYSNKYATVIENMSGDWDFTKDRGASQDAIDDMSAKIGKLQSKLEYSNGDTGSLLTAFYALRMDFDKVTSGAENTNAKLREITQEYNRIAEAANKVTGAATNNENSLKSFNSRLQSLANQTNSYIGKTQSTNGMDNTFYPQLVQAKNVIAEIQKITSNGNFNGNAKSITQQFVGKSGELNQAIAKCENFGQITNELTNYIRGASGAFDEFKRSLNNTTAEERATKRIATLKNQIQGMLSSNSRVIGTNYGNQLESLLGQLDSPTAGKNVDQIAIQVAQLRANIRAAGLEGDSLFTTIKNLFGQHLGTSAVMSSIHLLQQAFRQMYQNVVDIDSALTQVKIVTGESADVMSKFAKEAAQAAQEVGSTITDIMSSTETFARLGYSLEESTNMAKLTATFANVGDISVDDATTGITSILKGFNLEADQVEEITDKLILIARKYPIDAQGLAEALENGGAALAAAGNTLDESLALIQAGNAATQDAASVGELLRPRHSNVLSEISYNG